MVAVFLWILWVAVEDIAGADRISTYITADKIDIIKKNGGDFEYRVPSRSRYKKMTRLADREQYKFRSAHPVFGQVTKTVSSESEKIFH